MKPLLLALLLLGSTTAANPQSTIRDLSTDKASPERKAILDALRPTIAEDARTPVSFVVEYLKLQGTWAFFRGSTVKADGSEVAWERSAYADMVKEGMFDGSGTAALLQKIGGRWKVVTYALGPTDVAWACWWKEHKAPRGIFDLAEDCQ